MENRILIGTKEDTKRFFQDGQTFGHFQTQAKFCSELGLSRGHFWTYYSQRQTLPESLFNRIRETLPPEKRAEYAKLIEIKSGNWGQAKGGKITYSRYPEIFAAGRALPKRYLSHNQRPSFDINQPLTPDICEFLGAFSGDGFTNKYGRHYQIGFAGDFRYDLDYYHNRINPIMAKRFNMHSHSFRVKNNGMWFNFHSKLLFEMLTTRFGMPAGKKFDKVRVPSEILNEKPEHKIAFVRGVLDTDGCVFFDKRKTYREPYFRIDICMYNIPILDEIAQILNELGIYAKRLGNGKHVHVTSKEDVGKFLRIIGSSNQRHIAKIKQKYPDFDEWNPAHPIIGQ